MTQRDKGIEPIKSEFEPLNKEQILNIEDRLGLELPNDYRSFLEGYGGCGFSGDANVVSGEVFLPIFTLFDLEAINLKMNFHTDLEGEQNIPIADDMAGNLYVLDVRTNEIAFIDFSKNPSTAVRVCGSFNNFFDAIKVTPNS